MKDRIMQFMMKHMAPVPPEEQIPSGSGLFRGWSFRFAEKRENLPGITAAILIIGIITALSSSQ